MSSGVEPVREMTVIELLIRAGDEIDKRFGSQPNVAEGNSLYKKIVDEIRRLGSADR